MVLAPAGMALDLSPWLSFVAPLGVQPALVLAGVALYAEPVGWAVARVRP